MVWWERHWTAGMHAHSSLNNACSLTFTRSQRREKTTLSEDQQWLDIIRSFLNNRGAFLIKDTEKCEQISESMFPQLRV